MTVRTWICATGKIGSTHQDIMNVGAGIGIAISMTIKKCSMTLATFVSAVDSN
jgi:hypothetical protein